MMQASIRHARRAFLGMSHSPLWGLNPIGRDDQAALDAAVAQARAAVHAFDPELVILIGPDHYNGFFNELMPPFCIGSKATAVGDYLSPAGALNVAHDTAIDLARHLMDAHFDIAVSRRMQVDHGFSQALQLLWGDDLGTPPVVPIFLNAVAQPGIARLGRCLALGKAIGNFLDGLPQRTLLIGSGGLSHEPPVPTLEHPDLAVRERITVKHTPTQAERDAKTERVKAAGMALANGESWMKPLNPQWDLRWMQAMACGDLGDLCAMSEESIAEEAGNSAHESKTWLVARSALPLDTELPCPVRAYRPIPALIAGYGLLLLLHSQP
ncbi:2,3-dihydroxyphenylpropionate/2,3-dihydroxicinnamic acid 1,2-dioxygenase [Comamonas phosphati]|nr:2,3-dihydroxyphenylpropionate/2,3-dihydroxicinnamic acid 1,2-dioxygenase [Comamonas phosphati]